MELHDVSGRNGRTFALVHERLAWAEALSAFGEFDLSVADELQNAIQGYLHSDLPLMLDLTFCDYLDSTILRVLVHSFRDAPGRFGIVVPPNARIGRIFAMTRLDSTLNVVSSREELRARTVLA
jgi:anti-anti-sigma factor